MELLVALTLLILLQPHAVQGQTPALVLNNSDAGRTNTVDLNQPITVELRGNPSTGYEWSLAATNGQSVVLTGQSTFTPDSGGLTGAGGTFSFSLVAQSPGETILTFEYARSWEPTNPNQTLLFTIKVAPANPRLSIRFDSKNAIVTWPIAGSSGFYLEGCTTLSRGNWAALNAAVLVEGTNYKVVQPTAGPELYLRLRK